MTIKDFKKRIKLWSVSKLKMKFKHYYSAIDLSSNRERVLLRNRWLIDSLKAIKSELKRRGARITTKEVLGSAIDDVGANVGVAIGAFIIAGAVGFGLYKLVLEPAFGEKLPEKNDEPYEPEPAPGQPTVGTRYKPFGVSEWVNIRAMPSTAAGSARIGKLFVGNTRKCLDTNQNEGYWWCKVALLEMLGFPTPPYGWIRADKLQKA